MIDTPYKGLMPYTEEDAAFFFGRDEDVEIIINNLTCRQLTFLYGDSGVGKTSVLRCGVAHRLRQKAMQNLEEFGTPEVAAVVFDSWFDDDPLSGLIQQVEAEIKALFAGKVFEPVPSEVGFAEGLREWTKRLGSKDRDGKLFIILDQFEEYFLYHLPEDREGTFLVEFSRAVNCRNLPVHFLISIRSDSLSKLDCFRKYIPRLFDYRYELKHLEEKAARDAIVKCIEAYNLSQAPGELPINIEPELVNEILNKIKTNQGIEPSYLQLIMMRLWDEVADSRSRLLSLKTLKKLGNIDNIVREYVNEKMMILSDCEQEAAATIFQYLVTPNGIRISYPVLELAEHIKLSKNEFKRLMEKLSDMIIVTKHRDSVVQYYEIFHDTLASTILQWRKKYLEHKKPGRIYNKVFISYSHKDNKWLEELQLMLAPDLQKKDIFIWDDTKIKPGTQWKTEIQEALTTAKVAILLVSKYFLASKFIAEHELPSLLQASEKEDLKILWVLCGACRYKNTKIAEYQAAHDISHALEHFPPAKRNEILVSICDKILEAGKQK